MSSRRVSILSLVVAISCLGSAALAQVPVKRVVRSPARIVAKYTGRRPVDVLVGGCAVSEAFPAIKAQAVELLTRFAPKTYYYLGVGRSPAPVMAMFEALSPDLAMSFPAGGIATGDPGAAYISSRWQAYQEHFKALLPDSVIKGKRKILLVDYTRGPSLNNFATALRKYLKEVGSPVQAETFSLHAPSAMQPSIATDYQTKTGNSGWASLGTEGVAEFKYSSHIIGKHGVNELPTNPVWNVLVSKLREFAQNDKALISCVGDCAKAMTPDMTPAQQAKADKAAAEKLAQQKLAAKKAAAKKAAADKAAQQKLAAERAAVEKAAKIIADKQAATDGIPLVGTKPRLQLGDRKGRMSDFLSGDEYLALRSLTTKIISTHGGADAHYVAVGRTAAPVLAMIDAVQPKMAGYLPADGLGKEGAGQNTQAWNAHFDLLFPERIPQKIVLIRQQKSGKGLQLTEKMLKAYAASRGAQPKIVTAGINVDPNTKIQGAFDVSDAPALVDLFAGRYKSMAPAAYNSIDTKGDAQPKFRSEYTDYTRALRAITAADKGPELRQLTAILNGTQ